MHAINTIALRVHQLLSEEAAHNGGGPLDLPHPSNLMTSTKLKKCSPMNTAMA